MLLIGNKQRKFDKARTQGTDASNEHKLSISNHLIHKTRKVDKTRCEKSEGESVPSGAAGGSVDTTMSPLKQIHSVTQHFHLGADFKDSSTVTQG